MQLLCPSELEPALFVSMKYRWEYYVAEWSKKYVLQDCGWKVWQNYNESTEA